MNEDQMKGYLAFWNDEQYPSMHDIPGMWVFDPESSSTSLNQHMAAGWEAASWECELGEYREYTVHPTFGVMRAYRL